MGSIKDIANQPNTQTFPGATFEIANDVPAAQCSEAQIESIIGQTWAADTVLSETGKFAGWNLAGKVAHITAPPANVGDYDIVNNVDNFCNLVQQTPAASVDNHYYVTNGGQLILTRDANSFADFIHAAGYAYTFKGGKLHTDIPSGQLQPACTILWDPIT